jgi:hypothetical protein
VEIPLIVSRELLWTLLTALLCVEIASGMQEYCYHRFGEGHVSRLDRQDAMMSKKRLELFTGY